MERVAIAIAALVVLWRVVTVNALLYDEDGRPRVPGTPLAISRDDGADRQLLEGLARENPANAAAYLMLAQADASQGEPAKASRAYAAAYEVAPADRDVLLAVASDLLRRQRVAEALPLLARAVENYGDTRAIAFPVMIASLASGRDAQAWESIVAGNPAWLGDFVVSSCAGGIDPAAIVPLFLNRAARGTATPAETGCLVDRLRRAGRWAQAYQVWLDTLPRERLADVGFVFNGDFEFAPSGVGFDWRPDTRLERDSGHTVEFAYAHGANGARALRVGFNGKRQSGVPIAQYLALAPGRYEMSGLARPDGIRAGHGMQWTVRCVGIDDTAGEPIAASGRFVGASPWEPFSFAVTVPPRCEGQVLQLEAALQGASGPVFLAGTLWFDNLVLRQYH